ncbi:hypothetical protein PROP_00358 [Propionicimonas sp. T2.31MG-18]|uniref:hypothetical protein n=1 Tax=Propionicimonas sp. T2.31MG-18 TaxID=3157620 RepID=UPI0035EEFEF2
MPWCPASPGTPPALGSAGWCPLQPFLGPATGRLVTVEYPVLTRMLMWVFSLPGSFEVFVAPARR